MCESEVGTNSKEAIYICVPGQRLCLSEENTVTGIGTYERQGYIYSLIAGLVDVQETEKIRTIQVKSIGTPTVVPIPGDIVTVKVTIVNLKFAKCSILAIGDILLTRVYRGLIRKENVRATEKDSVDMFKSFKPGDILLARVLPQTELHTYQLSTAENELGVVIAMASDSGIHGVPMVPISWTEMQCPRTLVKEPRKIAKVVPEDVTTK